MNRLILIGLIIFMSFSCEQNSKTSVLTVNDSLGLKKNNLEDDFHFYYRDSIPHIRINSSVFSSFLDSIESYSNLELEVIIDTNCQEAIKTISNLKNIKSLSIQLPIKSNSYTSLISLTNITDLDISGITDDYLNDLNYLQQLQRLHFESPMINVFPPKGLILKNLKYFGCNLGEINELSSDIRSFKKINVLYFMKCEIKSIPLGITELPNIERLVVAGRMSLDSIPKEIGNMTKLKSLILWRNKLTTVPEELKKLKNLTFLNVGDNPISKNEKERIKMLLPNCKIIFENYYPNDN